MSAIALHSPPPVPQDADLPPSDALQCYRVRDVARLLAVSVAYVHARVADGSLRSLKLRGARRVTRADLIDYLDHCRETS